MDASTRKEGGTGRNADSGAFAFAYGFGYALDAWDDAGTYSNAGSGSGTGDSGSRSGEYTGSSAPGTIYRTGYPTGHGSSWSTRSQKGSGMDSSTRGNESTPVIGSVAFTWSTGSIANGTGGSSSDAAAFSAPCSAAGDTDASVAGS